MRCRLWGRGSGVEGLGLRVWGSGFGGFGLGFGVWGLRFRIWCAVVLSALKFGIQG